MPLTEPIVQLQHLQKHYVRKGMWRRDEVLRAVDGVSLFIKKGETLGLVGESGSGKSTTGQLAAGLIPTSTGTILFKGKDVTKVSGTEAKAMHKQIQYVFQDPYASLNPRHRIAELLEEPLRIHRIGNKADRKRMVMEMLERIGLNESYERMYTHELSGGQRQRIGIARSLMLNPEFLILDEPVSALDVSVQSQLLNVLKELQRHYSLTYLFISHDLNVVHYMSDRVAVMYLGKIVEIAEVSEVYEKPLHPYTQALVSAIPSENRHSRREKIILKGDIGSPLALSGGCAFQSRCMYVEDRCKREVPELKEARRGHSVSCHLV
ncbi:ATP-binding cassette domain-containing protein [Paenibacillus sp. GSMTC-2017]|uniref:ABC transporter ATP-binding protein n=1 Tax=Paenibacillus sp. GSMTC-2017 TaxID=2794350 RepID=UPI0018D8DD9D|nr:oligopeptide/dipeptide ABC transporter ATP-binding protein [Paenibacillus sp. GSMTC-2017]MBH5316973.1 ATP-binding cassette domain-containing protein [Paenibacillus sp. GSMTC-2017]